MASILATLTPSPLFIGARQPLLRTLHKATIAADRGGKQGPLAIVTKATGDTSESSTSLSAIKSVKNVWDDPEDRFALIGLGFAAIVALWASTNLVSAIDKLPLIPSVFELVGILFSAWFIYRYLLFKPDREELFQAINRSILDVLGR